MSLPQSPRPALPVSAPVRVRDLLRAAPDGPARVVHRGPLAVYVEVGDRCVGLLAAGAAEVPCGLRSRLGNFLPDEGKSAYLESGVLHIDSRPLSVGRVVDVHVPRFDRGALLRNTANSITCTATPPAAVVEFVVSSAPSGLNADAVAGLIGRGDGLTPLGDDVICGWLAARRTAGLATPEVDRAVRAGLGRTTLLSATLLDCALEGEVLPELGDWLAGVGSAAALLAVGGSSGAGLMAGALLALDAPAGHLVGQFVGRGGGGMTTHVELRSGAYADSVTLLQVSRTVQDSPGVLAAQVAMATPLNVEVLASMGFEVPAEATPNDLVVALRLADGAALETALAAVESALRASTRRDTGSAEVAPHRTTATALRDIDDALVLVSVPGASAFVEAMDALDAGRDVMVFSDNVPLDQEVALKRTATDRGLLVMGPDCGTAVVGGLGLGFANAVSPGPVGIVAASGTGCQQLLALLDHAGVGVTSALGVGGRDLSAEVGGLSTFEALRRLDADPAVELVVVVSKPPAPEVAAALEAYAATLATPVELALLGPGRPDLTAATEQVLRRLGREVPTWPVTRPKLHADPPDVADGALASSPAFGRVRLCGLFVGGTNATEARIVVEAEVGDGHTFIDFGDDAYTTGRAHPMIDPSLRLEHLAQVAADPATAVVLLDVVLGHGAEHDPAASLAPAMTKIGVPVVVAVIGTAHDPQDLDRQVRVLAEAGAEIHLSNAGATRRAIELLGGTS